MKNKIYYLGVLSCCLVIIGSLFKMQHWPLAGVFLTVGFLFFLVVFMPVALINSFKSEDDKSFKTLYVLAFVCVVFECLASLFKIMHWPGADWLILLSIPLPFIVFLPVYLYKNRNDKYLNYNNIILVLLFLAYMAAMSAMLSHNVSKDVVDNLARISNDNNISNLQTDIQIATIANDSVNQLEDIKQIKAESALICSAIDSLRNNILEINNPKVSYTKIGGMPDLSKIKGLKNNSFSYSPEFEYKTNLLKFRLIHFKEFALSTIDSSDSLSVNYITTFLNTDDNCGEAWERYWFRGSRLISAVEKLERIKKNVSLVELEVIESKLN